jgi:uncharacterized membrane protein
MIGLGVLPGHSESVAFGLAADGSVVVGSSGSGVAGEAVLWTADNSIQRVSELLTDLGLGAAIEGWSLFDATGVSADGRTIVGYGFNPQGQGEAWIAHVPEPSALVLIIMGGVSALGTALGHCRRRAVD